MADVYRTVITVEVFSDGPYSFETLADVGFDIEDENGNCIGSYETEIYEQIHDPEVVREHLIRIGNDGTYFDPVDC